MVALFDFLRAAENCGIVQVVRFHKEEVPLCALAAVQMLQAGARVGVNNPPW